MSIARVLYEDNLEIFLIESYPCNSKDELIARERYYIETMECVNKTMKQREVLQLMKSYNYLNYLLNHMARKTNYSTIVMI